MFFFSAEKAKKKASDKNKKSGFVVNKQARAVEEDEIPKKKSSKKATPPAPKVGPKLLNVSSHLTGGSQEVGNGEDDIKRQLQRPACKEQEVHRHGERVWSGRLDEFLHDQVDPEGAEEQEGEGEEKYKVSEGEAEEFGTEDGIRKQISEGCLDVQWQWKRRHRHITHQV